ncbi:MAG: DUF58 domain-containing protein [Clostridia bacterium]|nr:DUF58 domain-containing protein [Clostridia bacterium]
MKFFDLIGRLFGAVLEGIALFLLSPAAPYVLWTAAAVIAFFVLRAFYRRGRDSHLGALTVERTFSESGVYAGSELILTETVTNHGFFPLFKVDVEAYLYNDLRLSGFDPPKKDGMQFFSGRFNLLPYMRVRRHYRLTALSRGYYRIESATVPRWDGTEQLMACPAELYVYPHPIPLASVMAASGRMQGDGRAARQLFSDPFSFSGVRDYRYGDPMSAVNFKASAKTWMASSVDASPLKVNSRDFCSDRRLAVFMDFSLERDCGIDGKQYSARIEAGLSYAAELIREAVYGGFTASFTCNCRQQDGGMQLKFPSAGGEEHMLSIFRAMALLYPSDGASFQMLLDEAIESGLSDSEIFVIEMCPSERTDERLALLSARGNSIRVILLSELDEEAAAIAGRGTEA